VEIHKKKLQELFSKATWSEKDRRWLLDYLEQNNSDELRQIMHEYFSIEIDSTGKVRDEKAGFWLREIHQKVSAKVSSRKKIRIFNFLRYAAAVSVLIILINGIYNVFLLKTVPGKEVTNSPFSPENDLPPGGNKAVLTLGDGDQIILDTASNGMITRQAGAQVIKSGTGQIEYLADNSEALQIDYNTISTPLGGTYQLTLSDGTHVWLNAASSIRFPAGFSGKERKVFITGEAYFEVEPQYARVTGRKGQQKIIPFLVDVAGKGTLEVLGTHFNVNSYTDESAIKTTLLEGSVKFIPGSAIQTEEADRSVLISPGQQVQLAPDGQVLVTAGVDLEKVVAWKNGYFMFSSSSVQEVMNQIARWYNIEVVFEGTISDRKFGGKIQRDLNLSETLTILGKNNVRFKIEGRKLYVES